MMLSALVARLTGPAGPPIRRSARWTARPRLALGQQVGGGLFDDGSFEEVGIHTAV